MKRPEANHDAARRFWSRVRVGALLPYVILGALLVAAVVIAGRELHEHISAVEAWIDGISPWGWVVFLGLFVVLTSILVPDTVLSILGGALFGVAGGTLAVVAGSLAAAALQFLLSKRLLRARIEQAIAARPSLSAIQRAVRSREVRLQVLLRLTPLNPATTSYLLGATGVRFGGFLLAALALTPGLFLQVYFGYAGKHLAAAAGRDTHTVTGHDAVVVGGLLACIIVVFTVSRIAHRAVREAMKAGGDAEPESAGVENA